MKTICEIKDEQQERLSVIFKKFGIFFAFSQQQFDEQKKEGVTYVNGIVGGMLIPKENAKDFMTAFERHCEDCEKEMREQFPMDTYIHYELANHEAWYTGRISDAYPMVQYVYPDCTKQDMWRVWHKGNKENEEQ